MRLEQERARLKAALSARDSAQRRRVERPLEVREAQARLLAAGNARLKEDLAALERGVRREAGSAARLGRVAAGAGGVLTVGLLLGAWLGGAWLVCAHAAWPPALAVAFCGAPLVAMASSLRRARR